jgi:hypothetical protein
MKKKILKISILVIVALVVIDLIYVFYFTSGVSATFPPIKQYEYEGNINQLINKTKDFVSTQPNLSFKIDETFGNESSGFVYEMIIKIKNNSHDLLYELKCESMNNAKSKTLLKLIGAHDLTNDKGGYGMKADGMATLLGIFDSDVVIPLKNNNMVTLKPL